MTYHFYIRFVCILALSFLILSNAYAQLELEIYPGGLVFPRLDSMERNALSPALGQVMFNITTNKLNYYDGTSWKEINRGSLISDEDGDTRIDVEESDDIDHIKIYAKGEETVRIYYDSIGRARIELITTGRNTFVGMNTGQANQLNLIENEGEANSFFGSFAGKNNSSGSNNTFLGSTAGESNVSGSHNTFVGALSGESNSSGKDNTFLGFESGKSNSMGPNNTFLGSYSGWQNTSGSSNTFIGSLSGAMNDTGSNNSFLGIQSGYENTTGHYNSFFGTYSGFNNVEGNYNSFIGFYSGEKNNTGDFNVFLGAEAGGQNTSGSYNLMVGAYAGIRNAAGNRNTLLGYRSGLSLGLDSLDRALAIGYQATVGCSNCAVIGGTGLDAVNVGIGIDTPQTKVHVEGGSDVAVSGGGFITFGNLTGRNLAIDTDEIMARDNANVSPLYLNANGGNTIINRDAGYVGIGTSGPSERLHVVGNARFTGVGTAASTDDLRITTDGTLTMSTSDSRMKQDIETLSNALTQVLQMRGVSFKWKDDVDAGTQFGLIAQEVKEVVPQLVFERNGVYGINYSEMVGFFVEAIKGQQEVIIDLQKQIDEIKVLVHHK